MYNEQAVVEPLVSRLRPVLDALNSVGDRGYEVVCVDDGSVDATAPLLAKAREEWPELRMVRLLRNCGHQAALTAGLERARGDFAVTIDADLQDPPEVIGEMLYLAERERVDVVYGVRRDRSSDSVWKRTTASWYYRVMRRLSGPQLPNNAGDFRLVSRRVLDAIQGLPMHGRVYRLIVPWLGFPSAEVTYVRAPRVAGRTKYPLGRMLGLGLDSVTAFSVAPLRLATWCGLVGSLVSLSLIGWAIVARVAELTIPGWTSLVATVALFGGLQLLSLGLLGEYVARLFLASQRRPIFVIGYDSLLDEID